MLEGYRVLESLMVVLMWTNSLDGETLNKNTHPQTCTNLTSFLNKNTFLILFLYNSLHEGLAQLFYTRQVIVWSEIV